MKSFWVTLSRNELQDDFILDTQKVLIDIAVPFSIFSKIEKMVNLKCKNMESFVVKVWVEVEPHIFLTKKFSQQTVSATIISICNFDGVGLINESINLTDD